MECDIHKLPWDGKENCPMDTWEFPESLNQMSSASYWKWRKDRTFFQSRATLLPFPLSLRVGFTAQFVPSSDRQCETI